MSTLCAYENYLRDRYILGEPVRYMYGSFGGSNSGDSASKPKQTVFGPDNEEYTYVDDPSSPNAGRYARQIGGNGGGKTVFLDDVQKEYQKRQMEDASKTAQPQAADNRQSTKRPAQEKPARRPVKKTWNLTEIEDANGDFLDVQVKASSEDEAKQIVSDALKIQRDTRKKVGGGYAWELQEILEWGERNPEKFKQAIEDAKPQVERPQVAQKTKPSAPQTEQVDADSGQHGSNVVPAVGEPKNEQADLPPKRKNIGINSFGRYAPASRDVEDFLRLGKSALEGKSAAVAKGIKRYLQGAGVIDSSLGLTPLGQMLKEDRLRAAPYALINLVYNDPQIRWFYERYGDGGYHQFEDVYHDLVDAGYSKNVAKELVAGYKKFVADPALDVFPVGRLVDKKTFQVESTAPFVAPEHIVYALHSFTDKFLNGFPQLNLSKLNEHPLSPFNVFQADRENAKSLLSGASAKYPNLISASFIHDLEKISLEHDDIDVADVFRELTSETETDRINETTKAPEELDAQLDASGLGLPGKSDVALKPDIPENKDAADFIRRDLEDATRETKDSNAQQPASETKEPIDKPEVPNTSTPEQQPEPVVEPGDRLNPSNRPRNSFNVTYDNLADVVDEMTRLKKDIDRAEKTHRVLLNRNLEHEKTHVEELGTDILAKKKRFAFLARGYVSFAENNHVLRIGKGSVVVNPKEETQKTFHEVKHLEKQLRKARSDHKKGTGFVGGMVLEGRMSRLKEELKKKRDKLTQLLKKETVSKVRKFSNSNANLSSDTVEDSNQFVQKHEDGTVSSPKQQSKVVEETVQEQPAKPRPERWTPLKSKMNDDDKRVVENTRKRLNFGLADFAWRIADAKEKKDWQKAKELTVLAAQRYLEQARRAYRSHGGAEALAAFDESLAGEGITVGQVRDRVVDKFRQLALMNVADLHKYAGERLDEWEVFSQGAELPATKDKIALNRLLDKPHYAPNAVPYTPPEKGKIYEVPVDSLNLDPNRFQFKLNTNAQGVADDLEGAEFDPMQAGIIHVWRDPDDGKDYVVNGHHRFNLAKNSGYDGKVNVRYIDADTADDAKAFGAVVNIADSKGAATDVAEFIRTRGSDDIRTPAGKKIATKNKLLADGRVLSKLDDTIFRKLKNGSIDEKTARIIATELPDDKEKQLRLFSDIERLGLDASQAQDRAWAYASIQGEKQQDSLFGDDAPMEYDVESRSKLIGEIRKALGGVKKAAQSGGSRRNNEYWESQKLATNFDRDRAKQLSKSAGQTLDFFKDHIHLTGPMQNIIKEETDEYRKAIKAGKGAEKVVERAIERIKDVAQGGDGSVRRVEGIGLEYEDRLPSAKSEQTGQGVEAKRGGEKTESPRTPSKSLRNGTTGEVREAGGTDRHSDGGDGRNLASVIAEEAKKTDIPKSRVREELSSQTDKGPEKTSSFSASSPEGMSDWERELEVLRELNLLEDPDTTQVRKRGSGSNAAVSSSTQTVANGGSSAPSFVHTPTIQQRIDAYIAEQRAQGREVKSLTAEDYARIFPDEEQAPAGEQTTVPRKKRGRPRIIRTDDSKQTAGNSKKIEREAQKSEVPKEQVQERIAEALGAPSDTSRRKSGRRPKDFDSDSIKDDVEKAIQIRDADRSQLSTESIEYIMRLAQNVSGKHGATGLKNFMRRIDVTPTGTTSRKLLDELRKYLEAVSASRYNAMTINKMAGYQR